MAYPTVSGPYGFQPEQNLAGRVYNAATINVPIASGYAQNIGFGDLVAINSSGYLVRVDTTSGAKSAFAIAPIGVFVGCSYTSPTLNYWLNDQAWLSGTVASDAMAKVVNDPDVIMKAALTDSSGNIITSSGATIATVGLNIGYYQAAGTSSALINTTTKDSVASLVLSSAATTSTLPFRVYAPVYETALSDGTFCELFVTYNFGLHFYRQATGI